MIVSPANATRPLLNLGLLTDYGLSRLASPFTQKVRLVLKLKQIAYSQSLPLFQTNTFVS